MAFNPLIWLSDRIRRWGWRRKLAHDQAQGRIGEDLAHRYLEKQGYTVIGRNVRIGQSEVDLIALRQGLTVFVEVKARASEDFAAPEQNVHRSKHRALERAAGWYAVRNNIPPDDIRLDLISVVLEPRPEIRHAPGALNRKRR